MSAGSDAGGWFSACNCSSISVSRNSRLQRRQLGAVSVVGVGGFEQHHLRDRCFTGIDAVVSTARQDDRKQYAKVKRGGQNTRQRTFEYSRLETASKGHHAIPLSAPQA